MRVRNAELLDQLTALQQRRADLDAEELDLVKQLREGRVDWQEIADAIGVSKSTANRRFAAKLAAGSNSWLHRQRWDAGRPRAQSR